jgi:hypothetical protein
LERVETLETSWNTQLEPLWSNPIAADLANISAAMLWVLDQRDAEGALRMAVGLEAILGLLFSAARRLPGLDRGRTGPTVVAIEYRGRSRQGTRI